MSFHDILFPQIFESFLICKPYFNTSTIISLSGKEIRNSHNPNILHKYLLKNCYVSDDDFLIFNNFFKNRRGARFSFKLRNLDDYLVEKQQILSCDGQGRIFELHKIYEDIKNPYIRKIRKIKKDSLKLYMREEEIQNWQFNDDTELIEMENPVPNDTPVYASFEFYTVVRFEQDSFDYEKNQDGTTEILNVSLIEVL